MLLISLFLLGGPQRATLGQSVGGSSFDLAWSSQPTYNFQSTAWGDFDNDGDLDLAAGISCVLQVNCPGLVLFQNNQGVLVSDPVWVSPDPGNVTSLAWGDYDNDGYLDLAAGNDCYLQSPQECRIVRLYPNLHGRGREIFGPPIWSSAEGFPTTANSIAWGDYDQDGLLDLAVGNGNAPDQLYLNLGSTGGIPVFVLAWTAPASNYTHSVAWGDYDNDGDLDLAAGSWNWQNHSRVYRNDGLIDREVASFTIDWQEAEFAITSSVAWGDYNADGTLDLVLGNYQETPSRLYRNNAGVLETTAIWSSSIEKTLSIAWVDMDGDRDLDLALGNSGQPNRVYRNDGLDINNKPQFVSDWTSIEADDTTSLAWGDMNGDGAIDLAAANDFQPVRVYANQRAMLSTSILSTWSGYSGGRQPTTSLAWGDMDGDGDLDLVIGNACVDPNLCHSVELFRNDFGILTTNPVWSSPDTFEVTGLEVGDLDRDRRLDIIASTGLVHIQSLKIYHNNGVLNGIPQFNLEWQSPQWGQFSDISLADFNADGILDFAAANDYNYTNLVYQNLTGNNFFITALQPSSRSTSVAWGDVDNDGDLDLAVGNQGFDINHLYRNDGGTINPNPIWSSSEPGHTLDLAWGDVDGDGDLDLAVANYGQPNRLYLNDQGVLADRAAWSSVDTGFSRSLDWADYDGDGDLDLAVGSAFNRLWIYRNDGGYLTGNAAWVSPLGQENTYAVAWGDMNGDGAIDLAAGNYEYEPQRVYTNSRDGRGKPGSLPKVVVKRPYLDANYYSSHKIFSQDVIPIQYSLFNPNGDFVASIQAMYSTNGGGNWKPAIAAPGTQLSHLPAGYTCQSSDVVGGPEFQWIDISASGIPVSLTDEKVGGPFPISFDIPFTTFPFYNQFAGQFWISSNGWITLGFPPNGSYYWNQPLPNLGIPASLVAPFWDDLDPGSGGEIRYQQVDANTLVISFLKVPQYGDPGTALTFQVILRRDGSLTFQYLDMLGILDSATVGFQSATRTLGSQVVFNNPFVHEKLAVACTSGTSGTYYWDVYKSGLFGLSDNLVFRILAVPEWANQASGIPGPFLYGENAASTFPFRVRGTQVRVLKDSLPVPNALVYQVLAGKTGVVAVPISSLSNVPFRTDSQGYLQGRGEIKPGDKLVALLPVETGSGFTRYVTSAAPLETGLSWYTVPANPGEIQLNVSDGNQLILFDLDVSLEWDARQETQYLAQLKYDLQRASELLYDWTNGQAALGKVTIYHDRLNWDTAHIRIYANNRRRPTAVLGGIVSVNVLDPDVPALVYQPGMIHMGAEWNRYGNPGTSLGDDWPRALAHELGHYALYLDDDYLGLDQFGKLIAVASCTGTAMADPYRDDYSEFKFSSGWLPGCAQTLANLTTTRADWATIKRFYPAVNAALANSGPGWLPLAVTRIEEQAPSGDPAGLVDPRFYLKDDQNASLEPGIGARAYLLHADRLVDLGMPVVDNILGRGAAVGDKVCVIELNAHRTGCKTILSDDNQQLVVAARAGWTPQVEVTPVSTRTVTLQVRGLTSGLSLNARLYSGEGQASAELPLVYFQGVYSGLFNLVNPSTEGYVRVWNTLDAQQEVVTDYTLGGNPAGKYAGFAGKRAGFAGKRAGFAPGMSMDGQVILYSNSLNFPLGQFYTLQMATDLAAPPPWARPLGYGYWLKKSSGAPSLAGTSLSMGYLGRDVPQGEERFLVIYRWTLAAGWQPLATTVDAAENMAVATVPGEGLYALMETVELSLVGPGWDLFAYPLQAPGELPGVLDSIQGQYTTLYWFNPQDGLNPWKIYDVNAPDWANDLFALQWGEAYWIRLLQSVTLRLKGGLSPLDAKSVEDLNAAAAPSGYPAPPATYYGFVRPGLGFTPAAGMLVEARIGDVVCASAATFDLNGDVVYKIIVPADGLNWPGCGAAGAQVRFSVAGQPVASTTWDDGGAHRFDLHPEARVYLPIVIR